MRHLLVVAAGLPLVMGLVMGLGLTGSHAADRPAVSLEIRDGQFVPRDVQVPAGEKIELHVSNSQARPAEFESGELRREKVIRPGQQVSIYIGPLRPGTYEFFDDFNPSARGHLVAK
jgi:cupredoxin-like protein